ncbi:hypothetical protein SLS57_003071 [Botryosphaeria dothidea]
MAPKLLKDILLRRARSVSPFDDTVSRSRDRFNPAQRHPGSISVVPNRSLRRNMDNNSIYKFVPQDIVVPPTDWIVERYQRERENNLKHLDKMAALANEIEAMKLDLSSDNPAVAMLGDFVDTIRVAQRYAYILPPWPHDAAIPRVIPTIADALHQVPQLENGQSNANVVESNFRMAGESLMRIKAETDRLVARVAALEPHMRALHAVMKDKEDRELAEKVGEGLAGISYARDEDMESLQAEDGSVTDGQDGGEASSAAKVKVLVEGLETMDLEEEVSEKKKVEGDMEWEDEKEKMV